MRFSGHSQKTICRYSAIAVYAFKGPLAEGAGSAMFFRRDWRRVDLGFCFDFSLTIFRIFRGCRRGHCVAREICATQCNTPSVSRKNRAAATSLGEGGFKSVNRKTVRHATSGVTTSRVAQIRKVLIWLPGRLGEGGFKTITLLTALDSR